MDEHTEAQEIEEALAAADALEALEEDEAAEVVDAAELAERQNNIVPYTEIETPKNVGDQTQVEFDNVSPKKIDFGDRAREEYSGIKQLAASMREKGVIQPLAVQRQDNPKKPYLLLGGGRRLTAAIFGKILSVPVRVYPATLTTLDRKEIELIENVQRAELPWQDRAKLSKEIHDLKVKKHGIALPGPGSQGHTMQDTATLLHKDRRSVRRDINLAEEIAKDPEVASAKSEAEALRIVKKKKLQSEQRKAAAEFNATTSKSDREGSASPEDQIRLRLVNSYIVGDFFEGIKDRPDGSIAFSEIDPPYAVDLAKNKLSEASIMDGYGEVETKEYPQFMKRVAEETFRVSEGVGWCICWYGAQWYQMIFDTFSAAGWKVCPLPGYWPKNTQGQSQQPETRFGSAMEHFLYMRKDNGKLRRQGRNNVFDGHDVVHADKKIHPTERPVSLIQEIITTFCRPGGHVLVPFLGSGKTLLASVNAGHWAFGYDLDEKDRFKNAFTAKVQTGEPGKYSD